MMIVSDHLRIDYDHDHVTVGACRGLYAIIS